MSGIAVLGVWLASETANAPELSELLSSCTQCAKAVFTRSSAILYPFHAVRYLKLSPFVAVSSLTLTRTVSQITFASHAYLRSACVPLRKLRYPRSRMAAAAR
eukprot:6177626-Pleurochrysis_carterae.AAC.1